MRAPLPVLHIIPELPVGGAETLVFQMVRGLDRARFSPSVCVLGEPGPMGQEMQTAGIEVVALQQFHRRGRFLRLVRALRRVMAERKVAIVHTHLYHANYYGRVAALAARVPVTLASVHNVYERVKAHRVWINRWLGRRTGAILAGSERVREDILRCDGISPDRVRVLPYGIDLAPYLAPPDRAGARRALGLRPEERVIGTIGRLERQKGHDVLLQSFAALRGAARDLVLLLVGEGREDASLRELARGLGVETSVRFLGTRRDLPGLLAAMDLFAFPSRWEGLPLSLITAMAAGVPVVATPVGGVPDAVIEGITGRLVPPEDVEALQAVLQAVLEDEPTSRRLAAAGRERAVSRFSIAAMLRELEALYLSLAERAGIV